MPASQQISDEIEQRFGTSRREFMTFCTGIAATLGLANSATAQVAEAITKKERPSVIWLHHQECTGCTESMLRAEHPTLEKLILDIISLDYHETLFAAAGHQVEAARKAAQEKNKGKYLLVVEGAIPMKDGGIYCKIGGQTSLELTREAAAGAAAVIALGSCASWGGMPSTPPNPTGCVGVAEALGRNDILSIPGCPSNPYNFLACVVHFLTFGKLPPIDDKGRPLFAYSRLIHENCERRAHFDAGRSRSNSATKATARATASTSSAARGRKPTPTAPSSCSATRECSPGRSAWAILASAAARRASASRSPSMRWQTSRTSVRQPDTRASTRSRARA